MTWSSSDGMFAGRGGSLTGDWGQDQPERLGAPFAQSAFLHLLIAGSLFGYAYVHNFFRGSEWGSNNFQQGAIQATLVSSAALPLPQDHPVTDNVLATETPSPAPELAQEKTEPLPLPEAIPIPQKQAPVKKAAKPHAHTPPPQTPPRTRNQATYGEAAPADMPRATAGASSAAAENAVTGGDFGSRFGWYVDVIKRKVAQNWYLQEVQPGTPAGATVYVQFSVARDGSPGNVSLATSSGIPSLDSSCMRAVQRVDSFGSLPAGYPDSRLNVLYHCTFPGSR